MLEILFVDGQEILNIIDSLCFRKPLHLVNTIQQFDQIAVHPMVSFDTTSFLEGDTDD